MITRNSIYTNALYRIAPIVLLAFLVLGATRTAHPEDAQDLPNYFQFFMKTGKLEAIPAEVKRNELIASGELGPIHVGKPVPDFRLPDGFGNTIGLRDYVGKKNVVLTTMRTWW